MAMAAMLSAQSYFRLMDRIQHEQHHAHFANPLAGGVISTAHVSKSHHHDKGDTAHSSGHSHVAQASEGHHHSHDAGGHDHGKAQQDHQHGDATVLFLAAQSFVLAGCPIASSHCDARPQDFVSHSPRGPDHPPKPSLEFRV
jgi:hypothetical protein